jgi:two-component system, chemotaxis family, chemotaxis protein CheY
MAYDAADTKKTILIADDLRSNRRAQRRVLCNDWEKKGHPVIECEDGREAMEAVRRIGIENVALVMTDGNMPNMDGVELVAALRQEAKALPYRLPIMMISSDEEKRKAVDPARQPAECSADALFDKPFDIKAAQQTVDDLMARTAQPDAGRPTTALARIEAPISPPIRQR